MPPKIQVSNSQKNWLDSEDVSPTIIFGFWPLKQMNYPRDVQYQAYQQWELGKDFSFTHYFHSEMCY